MKNIVIVDGVRTPFGRLGGGLRQFHAADLAAISVKELIKKTCLDPKEIDAVYMGSAKGDARCPNMAQYTSLLAELPYEASAASVEMQCGSAIACINHTAFRILAGDADCIVVGGETINMDSWNPNGASGARIAMSAIRHMENTGGQFGLISSCCGGGIGVSALFENC